ncbi:Uncharacterized protein ToN1_39030 [Aromatoleum petrolei]|nr:Uncharacterized protein ToN1_39030 [Aromatoleum petrolei]
MPDSSPCRNYDVNVWSAMAGKRLSWERVRKPLPIAFFAHVGGRRP